jgi:hypothetical protein
VAASRRDRLPRSTVAVVIAIDLADMVVVAGASGGIGVCAVLCSDLAAWITGSDVVVDGGVLAGSAW